LIFWRRGRLLGPEAVTTGRHDVEVAQDDAATFEQFVRVSRTKLLLAAVAVTGDWHGADDLVQEALLVLHRRSRTVEPAAWTAYARTTLTHLAAHQHTTARSRREHLYAITGEPPTPPKDEEEDAVKRVVVQQALDRLPARQRRAVYLRFWHGLTTAEIALILGVPSGTVRSDLTRAVMRLGEILRPCFPGSPVRPGRSPCPPYGSE
jgi:RNA polymerase sigma factor (sigma-70 family)